MAWPEFPKQEQKFWQFRQRHWGHASVALVWAEPRSIKYIYWDSSIWILNFECGRLVWSHNHISIHTAGNFPNYRHNAIRLPNAVPGAGWWILQGENIRKFGAKDFIRFKSLQKFNCSHCYSLGSSYNSILFWQEGLFWPFVVRFIWRKDNISIF